MYAGHSLGLFTGGLAAIAAVAAAVPPLAHFAVTTVLGVVAGLTATRWLVDEPANRGRPTLARPNRPLMLLGVIAFCAGRSRSAGWRRKRRHQAGAPADVCGGCLKLKGASRRGSSTAKGRRWAVELPVTQACVRGILTVAVVSVIGAGRDQLEAVAGPAGVAVLEPLVARPARDSRSGHRQPSRRRCGSPESRSLRRYRRRNRPPSAFPRRWPCFVGTASSETWPHSDRPAQRGAPVLSD